VADKRNIMPVYTFKCPKCSESEMVVRSMKDEGDIVCKADGTVMQRDFKADFSKQSRCDTYPYASYAVGVDISEVPGQMKLDKAAGVPTNYNKDGDPIFTSRGHRKQYLKHVGFHDRNSFYGH
jgi:hypothetical protein